MLGMRGRLGWRCGDGDGAILIRHVEGEIYVCWRKRM
jgi:hypothetical protein